MEDGAGGKAAFRCFHGTLSKLAADVAAPKRELAVLDRSLLTRHAGTRPGVVPNDGDNAGVPGKGSSASSRQRIAAAGLIASSSPMMRDGLAEVI